MKGYDYSPALKASKIVWNVTLLQNGSPTEALIPGRDMGYAVDEPRIGWIWRSI